jgi:hypothetical protein
MDYTRNLAISAKELAAAIGLDDLEMMSLALEGLALVGLGQVPGGMRLLDGATASAVSGDMSDLKAIAATCCFMVFACERVRDVDRASQWCDQLMAFCRRNDMRAYLGFCPAHHASVLVARGRWVEADEQPASCREALRAHVAWSLTVFERLGELPPARAPVPAPGAAHGQGDARADRGHRRRRRSGAARARGRAGTPGPRPLGPHVHPLPNLGLQQRLTPATTVNGEAELEKAHIVSSKIPTEARTAC